MGSTRSLLLHPTPVGCHTEAGLYHPCQQRAAASKAPKASFLSTRGTYKGLCEVFTKSACNRAELRSRARDQREPLAAPEVSIKPSEGEAGPSGRQGSDPTPPAPEAPFRLIAALAAAGVALTGYLTLEKFSGGSVACPASGSCDTILSSGYASIFGIPLSLLGLVAYSSVAGLASWQAVQDHRDRTNLGRLAVLGGGTALASTSASLLFLLATQFPGQTCTWCLTSALLSFSIFVAAASGFKPRELADLAAPGGLAAAGTILFLSFAWSGVEAPQALADINIPYQETVVRQASTPKAAALAKRLRESGAKMYGAFWCSHCQEQKQAFGKDAQKDLPYVECFPDGYRSGVQMAEQCKAANLEGFPLWVINGERYDGEQNFSQLEAALKKPAANAAS